jgi:hypothetical protein
MYREFTKEETDWLKSFKRVMKKAPKTLFMFVGSGVTVYAKDENNNRYMARMDNKSVDSDATAEYIETKMDYDGGDY